jgi:hypothetical protein
MRGPLPSIYSCLLVGLGEYSQEISHATVIEEPPGDATWKEEAVGACRGACAPWCGLPMTIFLWLVATWAWATSMSVLGPDWMVRWALLFICLFLRFPGCAFWLHFHVFHVCPVKQCFSNTCGNRSILITYGSDHASLSFVCLNWWSNMVVKDRQHHLHCCCSRPRSGRGGGATG